MKASRREIFFCIFFAVINGISTSLIYYCEKLQFFPGSNKGFWGRIGLSCLLGAGLSAVMFYLFRKAFSSLSRRDWLPVLLIALILSVCIMVWFPMPNTGIYPEHHLEIRSISDENGVTRPVTLTWIHRQDGDIPLSAIQCTGNCTREADGPTLHDEKARLIWAGKTGETITIEFVSNAGQGIAGIEWDGLIQNVSLNNDALSRLSFDFAFPPSFGLPEFFAVWVLSFFVSLLAVIAFFQYLPYWHARQFGIGAFLVFSLFRVCQFLTVKSPLFFVDSESYLGMSQMSVIEILKGTPYCHEQYWYCIARPFFIPLVYKLCHQDPQLITIVQLVFSIASWGYFAYHAASLCKTGISKKAVIALCLGLGCIPNVTRWDQIIMSESLSISAALLLMGSLFWLTRPEQPKRWHLLPAGCSAISALLYAQSRDSAAWILIAITVILLLLNKLRSNRKIIFFLCALLAVISWGVMGNTGGRWQYPFENVLFNRILRDPQGEAFFIESGMPTPERIKELYGIEHMMGSELFNSEELAPLREWILSDGLRTYIRYLLRDPMKTLRMTWHDFEKEAFEQISYTFTPNGFRSLLPDPVVKLFSCNLPGVILIGFGLLAIFAAFHHPNGERFAFPILFVLSAYILCSGVFIADEYEFARHSMVIILMMKAAGWPLIIMLAEQLNNKTGS